MAARLTSTLLRTQNDRRLAALAAQGSEPAFEALIERYRKPLHAYCRRLLLDRTSSEDVVQQAFVSTWQALTGGRQIADVRAWLYRVVHNGAVNALRRSGYRHEELNDMLHGASAPEDDLEQRIAVRRALAGLADLPEMQREALLRTAVEGRSHVAVATELGVTETAVRGLVYRARATLRAAATALTPLPLAAAVAGAGGRNGQAAVERIAELAAGGGGGAATAVLLKGGATVATVGALAGGAVVSERATDRPVTSDRPAAVQRDAGRSAGEDPHPAPAVLRVSRSEPGRPVRISSPAAGSERDTSGSSGGRGSSSGPGPDGDDDTEDRSGPSRRSGRSGRRPRDDDEDRSGPSDKSGPGDGEDDANANRGPGGGDDGGGGGGDGGSGPGPSGDAGAGENGGGDAGGGSGDGGGGGSSGPDSGEAEQQAVTPQQPVTTQPAQPATMAAESTAGGDSSGSGSSGSGSGG